MNHCRTGGHIRAGAVAVVVIAYTAFAPTATAHCGGNHNENHPHCETGDPPPPAPDGSACKGSSEFPAFAYSTETVTGKRRNQKTTYNLFLANSDGSCSIQIFQNSEDPLFISYRQQPDGEGRIVWQEGGSGTISTLRFGISAKEIITPLPLSESTLYTSPIPDSVGILDVELSPDGADLYFAFEEPDGEGGWTDSIKRITGISACSNCIAETIMSFSNEGVSGLTLNDSMTRIYYASHKRTTDVYQVAFIEQQGGVWAGPKDVVNSTDTGYQSARFADTSWNPGSIAVLVESPFYTTWFIDVFQVDEETCVADEFAVSCLSAEKTGLSASNLGNTSGSLRLSGFTPFPSVPGNLPPNLLATRNGFVIDLDLDGTMNVLIQEGQFPDPAD